MREHVRLSNERDDAEERTACFAARAAVSPTTSATATGAVAAALVSASRTFVPLTTNCLSTVQFPLACKPPCTNAPVEALRDRRGVTPPDEVHADIMHELQGANAAGGDLRDAARHAN